jgi:hypothetical protein
MPRAKATTIDQEAEIGRLVSSGERSPSRIYRYLEGMGLIGGKNPVSEKTIARRIHELAPPDTSGSWSFLDPEPEARLVLDVAAYVVDVTDGRLWLTKELASWVARVRVASPDIPPPWAYVLARAYRTLDKQPPAKQDARAIDLVLATQPWLSDEQADWYREIMHRADRLLPGKSPERLLGRQPDALRSEIDALLDPRVGPPWRLMQPQSVDGSS